ncbi:SDR family oxidoreductase [Alcaligenaceae bacterium B3P038]|nr:SDR family oxidoreductase [Alcaligenaceae bacterium B3P038]
MSNNKHAVVTGASAGIGRAIAAHLLANGWQVSGLDIATPSLEHANFTPVPVDLADGAAIESVAATLMPVDALVHAAGVLRVGRLGELDHTGAALMWRLHVEAAARLADVMVPTMAARGSGRVVFVGSRVAQGMPGRGQYAATKAALIAMARSWAGEVAAQGVTVNVVSPAATATGMLQDPSRAASAPRMPPLGRLIEPAEIATLVAFLLSDAAVAITGQDIAICGGASLPS